MKKACRGSSDQSALFTVAVTKVGRDQGLRSVLRPELAHHTRFTRSPLAALPSRL